MRAALLAMTATAALLGAAGALPEGIHGRLLRAQARQGQLRILHFGDSHLVAAQDAFSRAFQGRGEAVPHGLGLPWIQPRRGLRATRSGTWTVLARGRGDGHLGLAGGGLETRQVGAVARLEGTFSRMRLHFLRSVDGGQVEVRLDGRSLGQVSLEGSGLKVFEQDVHSGGHQLELLARGGRVRLLGVALEEGAGVIHSPLAFNGAEGAWLQRVPESLFQAQMRAEAPDLVILAFGTNEAAAPAFRSETYRSSLDALLGRFRRAVPQAALVLVGPPDARLGRSPEGSLEAVVAHQRRAAAVHGALFIDQRQAMGGPGSIARWLDQGLAARDQVHLTPQGYQRLTAAVSRELVPGLTMPDLLPRTAPPREVALVRPSRIYTLYFEDGSCLITDDPRSAERSAKKVVRVETLE